MGINDEYSRDAFNFEQEYDSDETEEHEIEVDPEDFQALYSDEIYDAWAIIKETIDANYCSSRVEFNDFINLVMEPYKWVFLSEPNPKIVELWNSISQIGIIDVRLLPENFYGWAMYYFNNL